MAHTACIGNPNGPIVEANKLTIRQMEQCFYCSTNGCDAKMMLVSRLTDQAHFRSHHVRDHKFEQCIINSLNFDSSKYSESAFELENAIKHIVGSQDSLNIHNKRYGSYFSTARVSVGGNQNMSIRTLKELYAQCLETGIQGIYAGIKINDILASRQNFSTYCNGFSGFKIVEATYYKKVYNEAALLFNYPYYNRGVNKIVRVNFKDPKIAWDYYAKFKESNHREPLIIAGIWDSNVDSNVICECTFHKKNQIFALSKI